MDTTTRADGVEEVGREVKEEGPTIRVEETLCNSGVKAKNIEGSSPRPKPPPSAATTKTDMVAVSFPRKPQRAGSLYSTTLTEPNSAPRSVTFLDLDPSTNQDRDYFTSSEISTAEQPKTT